jgi:hypothetical protein
MAGADAPLPAIGELPIEAFEEALAGSRQVLADGRGWSTVSKRRIIAMAHVIALLDPERSGAEWEVQGGS